MLPAWSVWTPREIKFRTKWKPELWKGLRLQPGVQLRSQALEWGQRTKSRWFKDVHTSFSNRSPEHFSSSTILAINSSCPSVGRRNYSYFFQEKHKLILKFSSGNAYGLFRVWKFLISSWILPVLIKHNHCDSSTDPFFLFFLPWLSPSIVFLKVITLFIVEIVF